MTIRFRSGRQLDQNDLTALYAAVEWTAYTRDPARLTAAVAASLHTVTAWDGDHLVGLARVVGDGLTIAYLQDILVHPEYQRRGIGRILFRQVFAPFADVRQKVLLTDDEPAQQAFYEAMGFTEIRDLDHPTRAFARFGAGPPPTAQPASSEERPTMDPPRVLQIGMDPAVIDFGPWPGQDANTLRSRIVAAEAALRDDGFAVTPCLLPDDADAAEQLVRNTLEDQEYDVIEVGSGLRTAHEYTVIFERALNTIMVVQPGVRLCFNDSPETTVAAVRRSLAR